MKPLLSISLVARLPVAMLSIGLLVHTEHATGAYGAAGLVAGAFALAQGVGGPLLGRLVDRRGQTAVLVAAALVSGAALAVTAALASGAPLGARIALALLAGATLPPVGACWRALLPGLVAAEEGARGEGEAIAAACGGAESAASGEAALVAGAGAAASGGAVQGESEAIAACGGTAAASGGTALVAGAGAAAATSEDARGERPRRRDAALRSAYATDAAAVELTWVAGPPVVLAVGAAVSTGAALALAGALLAGSTLVFAAAPASRHWRPERVERRGGALQAPGMRTLAAVLLAVGLVFGAVEVAVTASAEAFDNAGVAGPLLGLWGVGSLIGGLVAAKLGGGARTGSGLVALLAMLGLAHAALALASGPVVLGALVLVAGATIAPTFATVYAMVDGVAPKGTATEAFAWLATTTAVGASAGAALAGVLVDAAGAPTAFLVAGVAAAVATITAVARTRTLPGGVPALAHA